LTPPLIDVVLIAVGALSQDLQSNKADLEVINRTCRASSTSAFHSVQPSREGLAAAGAAA
jgi:hypothetical protein